MEMGNKKPGPSIAVMFGGPRSSKSDDDETGLNRDIDEGEGMGGARKSAVKAIAKALGSQNADLASLDSALQAFVEACESGGGYGGEE